ncbi:sensor histidine kinase [Bacillus sp. ISL-40]|uniref:cache domain-containing sensor histidine kinase n=1 Tax=unclassified Bacillus (in: firmicutes) TaxID=185979 RepID=UPI001BEADCBD|nr:MULTISPECIES: histidine kinase [unclassified Bacillus (in: firmicutes)]MBT2700128.1 sensor histidine kinase [Bacillus sp. ISL-40]MBT2741215.1 sensor histidine kinase [Bacillus sp. ISL-77]
MKKILHRLKKQYHNLKIKYKLFLLVSWIMVISFSFTFFGLTYAFHIYDEQIYSKSSQVLSTSSNSIESELKNLEELTYNILTDSQIQQYLSSISEDSTEYDKFRLRTNMLDKLLSYANKEEYIQSINLVDVKGEEYVVGPRTVKLTQHQKANITKMTIKANGSNVWLNPEKNDYIFATAREIRQFRNLSFDNLGTIIIYINMDKLVAHILEGSRKIDGEFLIVRDNNPIFPKETNPPLKEAATSLDSHKIESGYQIKKIDNKNYFLVHIKSTYFDWGYLNVIPFNQIFENINMVKTFLIMIFILMFVGVTILGIRFARDITIPLENLVDGMQYVKVGDFKEARKRVLKTAISQEDEVGKLQQNFQTMIQQIDELINENYSKQLTIKETEFKALQAQINPHFLYNTLESINWLAKGNGQTQISKMVESLGFLLRNSISLKQPLITIEEELNIVKNYVIIQKYRFEERLDFHMMVDSDIYGFYIPKLTLQPIIENAIHYALEPKIDPCKISIYSVINQETIKLIVEDDGPGMESAFIEKLKRGEVETRGQGVGLSNINDRIKLSYGDKYEVSIESEPNKGTKVIKLYPL